MSAAPVARSIVAAAVALIAVVTSGCLPSPQAEASLAPLPGQSASAAPSGSGTRPSPTPKAHVVAIAAFVEKVVSGTLTYRVGLKGAARSSTHTIPIAGSMDVAGADFSTSFTYDFSREGPGLGKTRVQVRAVGGKGYIKRGAAAWQPIKGFKPANSYVPFKAVAATADVRYLGAVEVKGVTFHKIGVSGALLIHPNTLPYMVQKEKVDHTQLEVLIDDAGRPRSGTWTMWAQGRVGVGEGQLQRLVYEVKLTFARVGAKITIKRP